MYGDRRSAAYREGVHYFREVAEANKRRDGFMICPCVVSMFGNDRNHG